MSVSSPAELVLRRFRAVLYGKYNRIQTQRLSFPVIGNGDLRFAVRPQKGEFAARRRYGVCETVRKNDGQGQQLRCFPAGISDHDALIPGSPLQGGSILLLPMPLQVSPTA